MTKNDIIEGIHILVSNNVIGDHQLKSRYKGFRGELFFEDYISTNYPELKMFEGGIIISNNSQATSSLDSAIYLSIISEENYNQNYNIIFNSLSALNFDKMYLVTYSYNKWDYLPVMIYKDETINLFVPELKIYEYEIGSNSFILKGSNHELITDFFDSHVIRTRNSHPISDSTKTWLFDNLSQFTQIQLLKIYMNRLFLDGYIGFGKIKGKPSDIDFIIKKPSGLYRLLEIKEKDLPKQSKRGFGLDVPRLEDLERISSETKLKYFLVVRHIDNQQNRNLLGWKYILIDDFAKDVKNNKTVIGGIGMRSANSQNETLICSFDLFKDL